MNHFFVEHLSFFECSPLSHGVESFCFDDFDPLDPRAYLERMYDLCMDWDFASVFYVGDDIFGDPDTVHLFMYTHSWGYIFRHKTKTWVRVVDPCLEEFDCLVNSFEAFIEAAEHSYTSDDGSLVFEKSSMHPKYLVKEDDE